MATILWALAAITIVWIVWAASRSLVGQVPRNPGSEAALADAAGAVSRIFEDDLSTTVRVEPVWAHGCPCLRIELPADLARAAPEALQRAKSRAAAALEASIRHNPVFGARRGRYVGAEGLHWRVAAGDTSHAPNRP